MLPKVVCFGSRVVVVKTGQTSFSWQEGQTVNPLTSSLVVSLGKTKGHYHHCCLSLGVQAGVSNCHQGIPDKVGLDRAWANAFYC